MSGEDRIKNLENLIRLYENEAANYSSGLFLLMGYYRVITILKEELEELKNQKS